jgi:hypothetical protein
VDPGAKGSAGDRVLNAGVCCEIGSPAVAGIIGAAAQNALISCRGLFRAKYARRIFAIVSTTSIPNLAPASPTEATVNPPSRGSRLDADHPEKRVLVSMPIHNDPFDSVH